MRLILVVQTGALVELLHRKLDLDDFLTTTQMSAGYISLRMVVWSNCRVTLVRCMYSE